MKRDIHVQHDELRDICVHSPEMFDCVLLERVWLLSGFSRRERLHGRGHRHLVRREEAFRLLQRLLREQALKTRENTR